MSRRIERLNEQFKRELMEILRTEVRDPRVDALTVTSVSVSPDLYHARILLTTLRPESERPDALTGLEAATPFIRSALSKRFSIRRTPELEFQWDLTLDHARRIEQLLAEVLPPGHPRGDDDPADAEPEPAEDD
jgi:ribosome-binding factor A